MRLGAQRLRRLVFQQLPAEEVTAVREHIDEEGALTERFVLMSALSAGIATLGLLQSSAAVVIGAMLVSPLMGPIAALGFGIASLDGERTIKAARAVGVGALTDDECRNYIAFVTDLIFNGVVNGHASAGPPRQRHLV